MERKRRLIIILTMICISIGVTSCGEKKSSQNDLSEIAENNIKGQGFGSKKDLKVIFEKGKSDAEIMGLQGYMIAFQNMAVFDTPEILFSNKEQLEVVLYNAAEVINTKYENVEEEMLSLGNLSRERAEELFEIIKKIAEECKELTENVYLGKNTYGESDKKFLEKYNIFIEDVEEMTAKLKGYSQGNYGQGEETLKLGEAERGVYVVSTYARIDSLDTGKKWNQVEWIDYGELDMPQLDNPDMIYAEYYEKIRRITDEGANVENFGNQSGFVILPELEVGYQSEADNTLISGTVGLKLEVEKFKDSEELQEMRSYFNSDEELANYYLDVMVKCMQVFYADFGITDEMREEILEIIEESFSEGYSGEEYDYVSSDNEHSIKAYGTQILFDI